MNAFLVFKQGYHDDEPHGGVYGRKPLAEEPPERLALLPQTSVIFGDRDWIFTPSVAEAVDKLPHGKLRMVPGGHHHLYLDQPAKFHALALEALR